MTLHSPAQTALRETAEANYLDPDDAELDELGTLLEESLALFERLDELDSETGPPSPEGERSQRPPETDQLNAFATRCEVNHEAKGALAGYDVGIKDNIAVAEIEMAVGSATFEGYVPEHDATVVRRLLDTGATIVGKMNMGSLALGGSYSVNGPTLNPRNPDYVAGGSSTGSAAAVVADNVDIALGTDQGGSIRLPAAWSGCVGLKPSHGRVPYTGVVGLGPTFDHVGPMATTTEDCARTLDVISGPDPHDLRQCGREHISDGRTDDPPDASDLTVGVLSEGFGIEEDDSDVEDTVLEACEQLESTEMTVRDVSVPMHEDGYTIWAGVVFEELTAFVQSEGTGRFRRGWYDLDWLDTFSRGRRQDADQFPPALQFVLLAGQYLSTAYDGRLHAHAQNLRRDLSRAYDEALEEVDVLVMPTTPTTATKVSEPESTLDAWRQTNVPQWERKTANTAPFDVTGHPALSVPCGTVSNLPVGMQFVGRRFADETVLRAGSVFEQQVGCPELE
jgi:amidase